MNLILANFLKKLKRYLGNQAVTHKHLKIYQWLKQTVVKNERNQKRKKEKEKRHLLINEDDRSLGNKK